MTDKNQEADDTKFSERGHHRSQAIKTQALKNRTGRWRSLGGKAILKGPVEHEKKVCRVEDDGPITKGSQERQEGRRTKDHWGRLLESIQRAQVGKILPTKSKKAKKKGELLGSIRQFSKFTVPEREHRRMFGRMS